MRIGSVSTLLFLSLTLVSCKDKDGDTDDGTIGTLTGTDDDGDGFSQEEGDCDDADPAVYPGAEEECDGIDNDCDGTADEGVGTPYYQDGDGDGYGNADKVEYACDNPPDGFVANDDDCDDTDADRNPGEDEICDEVDNDCDDEIDENATDATTWYNDADADGYGDDGDAVTSCDQPEGYVEDGGDCNDDDAAYNPGATEDDCTDPNDYNCDGSVGYADADGDGFAACEDCNDSNASINPSATEVCDDVDNDCDSLVDDADSSLDLTTASTWFEDSDSDDYGNVDRSTQACDAPAGYVADSTDCNDRDGAINPLATEICDRIDNDCDDLVDDADDSLDSSSASTWYADSDDDSYGDADSSTLACEQPDGYVADSRDCDDTDAAVSPAGTEVCNDIDDDCDSLVDDDDDPVSGTSTWYADGDRDGYGGDTTVDACDAPPGYVATSDDCDDANRDVNPGATEVCNDIDDDCDDLVDDDDDPVSGTSTWYADMDTDGFGDADNTVTSCDMPSGYTTDASDCDDTMAAVNPDAAEVCNDIDDDCDDLVDDDDPGVTDRSTWYEDSDSDDFGNAAVSAVSCDQPDGYVADSTDCNDDNGAQYPGALEYCNDEDDDCDESIDEDAEDGADLADDADGDGYGDPGSTTWQCNGVDNEYDCDDFDDAEPKVVSTTGSSAGDGSMGSPYDSIQTAIEASLACVLVEEGTYYEAIDFDGRDIVVFGMGTDATYIDASGTDAPAVTIAASEVDATLSDLSVIGGDGYYERTSESYACTSVTTCTNVYDVYSGGGVYINGTTPTLDNVVVQGISLPAASTVTSGLTTTYTYSYGGGIAVLNGTLTLVGSALVDNFADQGGGLYIDEASSAVVSQTWFVDNSAVDGAAVQADMGSVDLTNVASMWNTATGGGGGLYVADGSASAINTTWAGESGSGLYAYGTSYLQLWNSIVYDVTGYGVLADGSATYDGDYNNVYGSSSGNWSGATAGANSISSNPVFVAWSDDGDYTNDDLALAGGSPSIDVGDPSSSFDDADGTRNDQGAWGGPGSDW